MVRLGIVMFIVMEKKAYLSGYLTTMTVMTLMTVICAGFQDGGYVFGRRRFPQLSER